MIIKSILDTDLYKFTTSYAYMKLFPQAIGTFEFKDRDNTEYTEEFVEQLRIELYNLAQLRLTNDEFEFMNSIRFIPGITGNGYHNSHSIQVRFQSSWMKKNIFIS